MTLPSKHQQVQNKQKSAIPIALFACFSYEAATLHVSRRRRWEAACSSHLSQCGLPKRRIPPSSAYSAATKSPTWPSRACRGRESSMRDLPCEKAGEGGIWAGDHGWGGGRSAGLLEGPWEVICGRGAHVPPQLRCSDAPVTGVTETFLASHSSTQGANRAAKRFYQGLRTAGVVGPRT